MEHQLLLSGVIKDMAIPWLFQGVQANKKSGTALFAYDNVLKKVCFANGEILFASSNVSEDRVGECMVRAGMLTKAQRDQALDQALKTGKKLGAVLVELGTIQPKELVSGLKFHFKHIIVSLFNWSHGVYIFDENPLSVSDVVPLQMKTESLIIEGLRNLDWEVVRKSFLQLKAIRRPVDNAPLLFQEAGLEQDHRTVFALIDGKKSIEEICSLSGLGDYNTLKVLYVLLALRIVEKK